MTGARFQRSPGGVRRPPSVCLVLRRIPPLLCVLCVLTLSPQSMHVLFGSLRRISRTSSRRFSAAREEADDITAGEEEQGGERAGGAGGGRGQGRRAKGAALSGIPAGQLGVKRLLTEQRAPL